MRKVSLLCVAASVRCTNGKGERRIVNYRSLVKAAIKYWAFSPFLKYHSSVPLLSFSFRKLLKNC